MNHVANASTTNASSLPLPPSPTPPPPPPSTSDGAPNGTMTEREAEEAVVEVDDEKPSMQPREPIVRSVPSIELPDGKFRI